MDDVVSDVWAVIVTVLTLGIVGLAVYGFWAGLRGDEPPDDPYQHGAP